MDVHVLTSHLKFSPPPCCVIKGNLPTYVIIPLAPPRQWCQKCRVKYILSISTLNCQTRARKLRGASIVCPDLEL
jgi:hypothetical protein